MSRKLQKRIKNLDLKSPSVCKYLSDKLDSFCDHLDKLFYINGGGCCWVAYCLSKLLKQTGFNVSLVVYDIHGFDFENINSIKKSLSHYYIMIKDRNEEEYFINSFGYDDYVSIIDDFNIKDLKKHYLSMEWCCEYDSAKNRTIYELLKAFYLDLLYDI
jgi:hypothetical protein